MSRSALLLVPAALLVACSTDESAPAAPASQPPDGGADAGACAPGETASSDGGCTAAGIPPDECADGFEPDGANGCRAILPADPCPSGQMAIPGELACHEVAPCGAGDWGDIPTDATTQHVNAAYAGGASDGSAADPWKTVQAAIDAADPGAIVAIAAGTYAEDLSLAGKPVRLWGRCPAMVELRPAGAPLAVLSFGSGAQESEIRGVAITGAAAAAAVLGVGDVSFAAVWIHDTASQGIHVESNGPLVAAAVTGSLIERTREVALYGSAAELRVERSVVRDTRPATGGLAGRGVSVQYRPATKVRSGLELRDSIIEQSREIGVYASGSDVTIERVVVRDTQPQQSDMDQGRGISVIQSSDGAAAGKGTIRDVVVERCFDSGILVGWADLTIERTVVRDMSPNASNQWAGRGIEAQAVAGDKAPAVVVRSSVVTGVHDLGVRLSGGALTLEQTLVRDVLARAADGRFGRGVHAQDLAGVPATLVLRGSRVEGTRELGVSVVGAATTATIEQTLVAATSAAEADGLFGDGLVVERAHATITGSAIEASARAGISNFGGFVEIGTTALQCNPIHLDGETYEGVPAGFDDTGGNACGCAPESVACELQSSGLTPPEPVAAQ